MDNQTIDVVSEGRSGILHALSIMWRSAAPGGKATHYKVVKLRKETRYHERDGKPSGHWSHLVVDNENGIETLILLWHEERQSTALPYPLTLEQSAAFIGDWLGTVNYGGQPSHDGDNGKGWRLFTEGWGHVADHHYAIIAVQPAWAMYGK